MYKSKKGFTLIEMLIVIAIIGILASIILVGLGTFRGRGRDARRISDVRQVQNALELYFNSKGAYPLTDSWTGLRGTLTGAGIGVSTIASDPTASRSYGYCSDGAKYVLEAVLEDAANPTLKDQENAAFSCQPSATPPTNCSQSNNSTAGYCITL